MVNLIRHFRIYLSEIKNCSDEYRPANPFSDQYTGCIEWHAVEPVSFVQKKQRSIPAIFLSVMLLAISIRIGNTVFLYFNNDLSTLYLQVGHSAFFIGPAVYYFFLTALNKSTTVLPSSAKYTWSLTAAIVVISGLLFPYTERTPFWCTVVPYIIYAQWPFFLIATGIMLKPVIQRLSSQDTSLNTTENSG